MCGGYSKPGKDDVENGPTFSACYVGQSEVVLDGSGMPRTTSGRRFSLRCKNDGSMSTFVKRLGTTHDYMLKDGARRCLTASPSQLTAQLMSLAGMCERLSRHLNGTDVPRKSCSTSKMRSACYEDRTWQRTNDSVLRRRIAGKTRNSEDTSWHQLLNPSSTTSDQSIQQP
jgi:hypothetical protein